VQEGGSLNTVCAYCKKAHDDDDDDDDMKSSDDNTVWACKNCAFH